MSTATTTSNGRPTVLPLNMAGIPAELQSEVRWVNWRLEKRKNGKGEEKWTKTPRQVGNGRNAKSNDPATWSPFVARRSPCLEPRQAGAD